MVEADIVGGFEGLVNSVIPDDSLLVTSYQYLKSGVGSLQLVDREGVGGSSDLAALRERDNRVVLVRKDQILEVHVDFEVGESVREQEWI